MTEQEELEWIRVGREHIRMPDDTPVDDRLITETVDCGNSAIESVTNFLKLAWPATLNYRFEAVTSQEWAEAAFADYAELILRHVSAIAGDHNPRQTEQELVGEDAEWIAKTEVQPLITALSLGAMRSYEILVPRICPLRVCATTVALLANRWDVGERDLLRAACIVDAATHVVLNQSAILTRNQKSRVDFLDRADIDVNRFVDSVIRDPDAPNDPSRILFPDVEESVAAFSTQAQVPFALELTVQTAVVLGIADYVTTVLSSNDKERRALELLRRHQTMSSEIRQLVGNFLGAPSDPSLATMGRRFIEQVVTQRGLVGVSLIWTDEGYFPAWQELQDPTLWLQRMSK